MVEYYELVRAWLLDQYGNNDFLVGTTLPFVLAAIAYGARNALTRVWGLFLRYFTISIRMNSTMEQYDELAQFIFDSYVWGVFKRDFVLGYSYTNKNQRIQMSAGYGHSLAIVHGSLGYIVRQTEDSDAWNFKEWIEIRAITWNPKKLAAKVYENLNKVASSDVERTDVRVYRSDTEGRNLIAKKPKRPLNTVFLPQDVKDKVMKHLKNFEESEDRCIEKGTPWHTGIIVHGPPGTGKTSFIHAIASEMGRDIHYSSGGAFHEMDIDARGSILVLEDFDAAAMAGQVKSRKKKEGNKNEDEADAVAAAFSRYSLADILNFLDGFLTPHGLVVIASTNHIDTLDDALIRPGRFDLNVLIDEMQYPEYVEMCEFHGQKPMPSEEYTPQAGADLSVGMRGI